MVAREEIGCLRFQAVEDLIDKGWPVRRALECVGVARSTWYYRANPRPKVAAPIPQGQRRYRKALREEETQQMEVLISRAWEQGQSVSYAFAKAWSSGEYIASHRSWYRVANRIENQDSRPRQPRRRGRKPVMPVVKATKPGQVWMWDITDLKGPFMGVKYKAYCVQDLYSRKIVAYGVHNSETDRYATAMFERAFGIEGIPKVLHSDNGPIMRSGELAKLCGEVDVTMSFNRPSVSDDNPFKESEFRTMKHRPNYPGYFNTLEDAQTWIKDYVHWYNTKHHHSALGLYTPQSVADGTWKTIHKTRTETLNAHYKTHPHRYNKKPKTKRPPKKVGINLPKTKKQKQTTH